MHQGGLLFPSMHMSIYRVFQKDPDNFGRYLFRTTNDTMIPFGVYDSETHEVLCTPCELRLSHAGHEGGTRVLAMFSSACLHLPVRMQL